MRSLSTADKFTFPLPNLKLAINGLRTIKLLTTQSQFLNLCFISKRLIHVTFSQDLATLFFEQKLDSWERKNFITFLNYLKFLRQCPKAIHGRTHFNKIKKPC